MIKIEKAIRRNVNERCRCCESDNDTMRINFSIDGTDGTSVVLCDKCRKELIKVLEYVKIIRIC